MSEQTPPENPAESIRPRRTPENDDEKSPPALRAELQIPQAVIDAYQADQRKRYRLERGKFWLELLTLLAVVGYATVAYLQYGAMVTQSQRLTDTVEFQWRPRPVVQSLRYTDKINAIPYWMDKPTDDPGPPYQEDYREIDFTVENVGHGEAFQLYVEGYWQSFAENKVNAPVEFSPRTTQGLPNHLLNTRLEKMTLRAGEQTEGVGRLPVRTFDQTGGGFIIFGWVEHCDLLKNKRYDPFCFWVYDATGIAPFPGPPIIQPCETFPKAMDRAPCWQSSCR